MDSDLFPLTFPEGAHLPVRAGTELREGWRYRRLANGDVALGKFTGDRCIAEIALRETDLIEIAVSEIDLLEGTIPEAGPTEPRSVTQDATLASENSPAPAAEEGPAEEGPASA